MKQQFSIQTVFKEKLLPQGFTNKHSFIVWPTKNKKTIIDLELFSTIHNVLLESGFKVEEDNRKADFAFLYILSVDENSININFCIASLRDLFEKTKCGKITNAEDIVNYLNGDNGISKGEVEASIKDDNIDSTLCFLVWNILENIGKNTEEIFYLDYETLNKDNIIN